MKATIIHNVYLTHKNGLNTVLGLLLKNKNIFFDNGIELCSVTPDDEGVRNFTSKKKGYKQYIKDFATSILTKCAQVFGWGAHIMMIIRSERFSKKMALKYIASNPSDDDVVFIHSFFVCYYYLKFRKKKQLSILVLHNNGDTFKMYRTYYRALEKSSYYKTLLSYEEYVLENVDRINFVSESSRNRFLELHPSVPSEIVSFIHNGVDDIPYTKHEKVHDPIEICCVASITERKGQRFIVDALASFNRDCMPNVHFTIVGDGTIRLELENIVRKCGLESYISFVGISNNVPGLLSKSDIFILPSEDEGLPMSILEAMREGLPIVSTAVGGIPEMVEDGVNGIFIRPSTEGVLNFLHRINDYDWCLLGYKARKTYENKFSSKVMILNYCNLLKK